MSKQPSTSIIRPEEAKFTSELINFMATTYNYVNFLNSPKCPTSCDKSHPSAHKIKEYNQKMKMKHKETQKQLKDALGTENREQIMTKVNRKLTNFQSKSMDCLCDTVSKTSSFLATSRSSERTVAYQQQYQTPMGSAQLYNQTYSFNPNYASTPNTRGQQINDVLNTAPSTSSNSPFRPVYSSTPRSQINQVSDVLNTAFIEPSPTSPRSPFRPAHSSTPRSEANPDSDVLNTAFIEPTARRQIHRTANASSGLGCKYFSDRKPQTTTPQATNNTLAEMSASTPQRFRNFPNNYISGVAPLSQTSPRGNQYLVCSFSPDMAVPYMRNNSRNISPTEQNIPISQQQMSPRIRTPIASPITSQPTSVSQQSAQRLLSSTSKNSPCQICPELPSRYYRSANTDHSSAIASGISADESFGSSNFSNARSIDCECDDEDIPKTFSGLTPQSKVTQCSEGSSFPVITPPKFTSTPKNIQCECNENADFVQQNTPPGNELPSRYFRPQQMSASSPGYSPLSPHRLRNQQSSPVRQQYLSPQQQQTPPLAQRASPYYTELPSRYLRPNASPLNMSSPRYLPPRITSTPRRNYIPSPSTGHQLYYNPLAARNETPPGELPSRYFRPCDEYDSDSVPAPAPIWPRDPLQSPVYLPPRFTSTPRNLACECD